MRRKLQALVERGVDGEQAAAVKKLQRLESKVDFSIPDDGGSSIFDGIKYTRRGDARGLWTFLPEEHDVAGFCKWAIEQRTGLSCSWAGNALMAETAPECLPQLQHVAQVIRRAFLDLWASFSIAEPRGRHHFMLGLYDGMMGDEWKTGAALPHWSPPAVKKMKGKKKAGAIEAQGCTVHPYSAAVELGRRIRLNTPIGEIVEFLEVEVLKLRGAAQ